MGRQSFLGIHLPVLHCPVLRFLGALLLAATSAAADEPLSDEMQVEAAALKAKIDLFFRQLSDKTVGPDAAAREAIGGIVGSGPLKDRSDDLSKLVEQATLLPQRYGDYTGHDPAGAKAVGNDLLFLRYVYKGERFPVIWHFTFYRAATPTGLKREWSLISLRFDTKIETLER